MVYPRSVAVARANASKTYSTRMCMQWTRIMFGIGAVGDYDGDGAADAEDGWKASVKKHRDRKPPAGVPVWYGGGSSDNGHVAVSLGPNRDGVYMIRTTDGAGAGINGTRRLDFPEKSWGMPYLGWSEDIGGTMIPNDMAPKKRKEITELEVLSWNVLYKNDADAVVAEVKDILTHQEPEVMVLYESIKLYNRLEGMGYAVFQFKPRRRNKGHTSHNGNIVVMVRRDIQIARTFAAWMKLTWIAPRTKRKQDPRVYRGVKIVKNQVTWKIMGVHLPFGAKPRRESVVRIKKWISNTRKGTPVIVVGDWQKKRPEIVKWVADPINARVAGSGIDLVVFKHCGLVEAKSLGDRISDHPLMRFRFRKVRWVK